MNLRRAITVGLSVLLFAGMTLVLGVTWLTRSNDGARWVLDRVLADGIPAGARARIDGNFATGVRIPRVSLQTEAGTIEIESALVQASLRWFAPEIEISRLEAERMTIVMAPASDAHPSPEALPGNYSAPVALRFKAIGIERVDLLDADRQTLFEGIEITASGHWREELQLELASRSSAGGWHGHGTGSVELTAPYRHEIQAVVHPGAKLSGRFGLADEAYSLTITGEASGSDFTFGSPVAGLSAKGRFAPGDIGSIWSVDLALEGWPFPDGAQTPDLALTGIRAEATGRGVTYQVTATASAAVSGLEPVDARLAASGSDNGVRIDALQLASSELTASATGGYRPGAGNGLDLEIRLARLDPAPWIEDWPQETPVNGRLALHWAESGIELDTLLFQVPGRDLQLTGSVVIDTGNGSVEGRLDWSGFRWPLDGPARLESPSAGITLGGQPEAWWASGRIALHVPGYPGATLPLSASGGRQGAALQLQMTRLLGGEIDGDLEVDWQNGLSWQGRVEGRQVDPSPVLPEWPGRLDFEAGFSGRDNGTVMTISVDRLAGELLGRPVEGRGRLDVDGDHLTVHDLRLTSGTSHLSLDGSLEQGLAFDLTAQDSPILSRWLKADATGRGWLRLRSGKPEADLDLQLSGLEIEGLAIGQLSVAGHVGGPAPDTGSTWVAQDIVLDEVRVDRFEAALTSDGQDHFLKAQASLGEHRVELAARGSMNLGPGPNAASGSGTLDVLTWRHGQERQLALATPASFTLASDTIRLLGLCLVVELGGQACADIDWTRGQATELRGRIDSLPVRALAALSGYEIEADQQLTGNLWWTHTAGSRPSGEADFSLVTPNPEPDEVIPEPGLFRFSLKDGELTEGRLFLPIPGAGEADVEFAIKELGLDGNGLLQGRARLDLNDLSFLQDFISGVVPVSGRLDVDARLSGRVAEPHLDGRVTLEQARFDVPALELKDVRLSLSGDVSRADRLYLEGSIASGPGQAAVKAVVNVADWNSVHAGLTVKGDRLLLIDVPSLRALASPDLHLAWQRDTWRVDGSLSIPEARISPAGAIDARVVESEDVEIVNGSLPDRPAIRKRATAPVNGKLALELGSGVRIDMPSIQMRGSGELDLEWQGAWLPQATGQVLLNGELRTYGPRLLVEQGPVRFSGRPIDDPVLDIRAERDILGNTQIRTAGVYVRGTLKRPRIEAYTIPLTNEDRAWTLLLTGSDFQYGQGVGAFDIGTYIAPRLYISYGVSLFDDDRVVSARYDLRRGFGIKATASQKDNGIDASFTVER